MRAVAIKHTDMTDFILRHALRAARKVIGQAERLPLSERGGLRVLAAQECPAAPNARRLATARRPPKDIFPPRFHRSNISCPSTSV
ncbi:MAG: DUF1778 domain-containing protein [Azoarcus sp.]|jgi:uncharacterized protein (DUF1778 family)|nr:DUF1778 domain-containing protein [Azoarcus sp.]